MAEACAEASDSERVFTVGNRPLMIVAIALAIAATLPVTSLYELITSGTIDIDAVGRGRREIPNWLTYSVGWLVGAPFIWSSLSLLRYVRAREMFRLCPQGITIHGVTLAPEEVLGFRYSFLRGHVLQSARGDFPIHPWMVKGGVEALADAFPHVLPLKRAELPPWALGE